MDQCINKKAVPPYKKYPLSRIVSVREIVSADYIRGVKNKNLPHSHPEAWELCFCLEGEVIYLQEDRERRLRPGQVVLTAPGVVHDSVISDPEALSFFIAFTCSDTYIQLLRQRMVRISRAQERLLERLVEELYAAFELSDDRLRIWNFVPGQDCPLGAEQMICCYLEQLLIGILRELTMQNGRTVTGGDFVEAVESDLVNRVNRYIDKHLTEPITVELLCREFHYGRTKLSTTYKKAMGMGINAYIAAQRLERARQLLEEGSSTVSQIADQVGFSSPQYFSRKFFAAHGCSPTQYAERYRKNN